jgi:hypothetical protein
LFVRVPASPTLVQSDRDFEREGLPGHLRADSRKEEHPMPRVNRVYDPDRAQLLHTFSHLSEGIIPEFWARFGTNCGPLEHPVVREKFFEYFDRAFAYFRGIDLVDYAIQPNHIHLAILTNPAPIPLEEVARVQAELRDEVLNPKDPGDRKRLVEIEKDMHNYSLLMKQVTGPFGAWPTSR